MNLAVEEPSKIIKVCIRERACSEDPKLHGWDCGEFPTPANSTDEDSLEEAAAKGVSIDFFSLDDPGIECSIHSKMRVTGTEEILQKPTLEEDFFRNALGNDIRVMDAKYSRDAIFVYFSNLQDSVSFYRQFLPYAEISFSSTYDFEQMVLLSSSEWTRLVLGGCSNANEEAPSIKTPEKAVAKISGSAQEAVFEKRVEHFSNLRNFFSKNDVKLMAQSLEAGCYDFVFRNTKEMAVGSHSNKIMQDAIKLLSEKEVSLVIESLGSDIAPIAANKHGAYTVQMLISASKTYVAQGLLSKQFRELGRFLIKHEIGNYTIQKILRFDPDLVFDFFVSSMAEVVKSELGMKVLRRCLDFFADRKLVLIKKARECMEREPSAAFSCLA